MFSEGGKKFIGLEKNPHVCLAIYDRYEGFGALHGMQVMGLAELVEPFSEAYNDHAARKKISLEFLRHRELASSPVLNTYEKEQFSLLANGKADEVDCEMSLQLLSLYLHRHYG